MAIIIERGDEVWVVRHDRPEARNAMDPQSADDLVAAFEAFEKSDAKIAVLTGTEREFCAGWDLKYAASLTPDERKDLSDYDFPMGSAPAPRGSLGPTRMELSKPVIAAIEGPAVAGGMELAMWCDIRVMGENAYFGVFCRRWGIPLTDGGAVRLPRLVGEGKALEIALTGRKVSADESYGIGLCERVTEDGKALETALEMASQIARFPQQAMLADRRSIYETHGLTVREALKVEWANGLAALRNEGFDGAGEFSDGAGRHGDFGNI
ncbi:crotonase/enoyl-CoA hydratase family protein [Congregibacter brevis]|uniref:Crotonase/enoyl-CoA hydratase family protein n=1 Tax=Congregibacter brevis TaxID=3081201 RepID=A0ABZ0IEX9_9GAMM|nr:crotonase/enoyl-CoA hydratase family protein [Congregibacter sp. IMCC45268]